ncbi:MAG: regulatory iron-sulfur-containing complex subunit RicT [candidate division NC10 bacterium]
MVVKVFLDEREREQFYEAGNLSLHLGAQVLVEHGERLCVGKVVGKAPYFPRHKLKTTMKRVMHLATPQDLDRVRRATEREREAGELAARLAETRDLPMKIVQVRLSTHGKMLTVFFTAEERVDFRELVRDLAQHLRARIEMKQIGARDEAAITGAGLGSCGRTLCCKSWLPSFHPVTMKMAKEQKLSLNSAKITGVCGRLKCCLAFEYPIYSELARSLPKMGQPVDTPQGPGIVQAQDILGETVMVQLETGDRLRVTLEEIMQITTARYQERGGGHPCNKCSDGSGCGMEGCGNGRCRANSMTDDEQREGGPG